MAKRRQSVLFKVEPAEGFDEFWALWPKRVARLDAEKAWNELRPDAALRAEIQSALAWQTQQRNWQRDDGAFIPYPASWIRAQRWRDESPRQYHTEEYDWFAECQRLHQGKCNGRHGHRIQLLIDGYKS